jgi:hypothetical protein
MVKACGIALCVHSQARQIKQRAAARHMLGEAIVDRCAHDLLAHGMTISNHIIDRYCHIVQVSRGWPHPHSPRRIMQITKGYSLMHDAR